MKGLKILIGLLIVSLQGLSQSSDSIIVATKDAKRVLEAATLSKQYEKELDQQIKQVNTLFEVVSIKDSLIKVKEFQIDNYKKLSQLSESNYIIEQNKRSILQQDFDKYKNQVNKEIKSIRRKGIGGRILTGVIGAAIGIIVGSLYIK